MKIGILTFQASENCGSMLQAYALRETLARKFSIDTELINYANFVSRSMYGYYDMRPKKSAIAHNIENVIIFKSLRESKKWYFEFSDKFLVKSDRNCKNEKDLSRISNKYDIIIAGGDQIWNVRCADAGKEFFLNFTKNPNIRKVAFSPSLGGANINKYADDINKYKKLLLSFEMLSVREPNGKKWLEELTGREVPIIADPTLLLTQEEWCTWLPVPEFREEYIFNYAFYHNRPETNRILENISKITGLPVIVMDYKSYDLYKLDQYGIKKCEMSGPLAFLGLMKNASLVLTQSFHGTLFSALFNRPFWSYDWEGTHNPDDDRAIAILNQFGLQERYKMIDELKNMSKDEILEPVNYKEVNVHIEMLRKEAMEYIESFIGKKHEDN